MLTRALFEKLIQPEPVRVWFREALIASTAHQQEQLRARCSSAFTRLRCAAHRDVPVRG